MRKYLFIGDTRGNTGPSNVNKGIVANLSKKFSIVNEKCRIVKAVSFFKNIIFCKVIVVSGLTRFGARSVKIGKILRKKTIYIMHGCYEIETELNEMPKDTDTLRMEQELLHNIDLLLPVSKRYSEMIQKKYPFCKGKTQYLHNGVDFHPNTCGNIDHKRDGVIAVGGDRKLKNNIVVANAMSKLDNSKILTVYGHLYHPNDLPKGKNIKFKGLVPQKQLYAEMMKSKLYILNSVYEPFALSVFDALQCGCSILVTNVAGALELLGSTEHDVIYDPMDEDEIAEKIDYLLQHPNNERLTKSLDFDKVSYKAEVKRLEQFCEKLCQRSWS